MNAKERVSAYMSGKAADRVPNMNIIMQFGAQYIGAPFSRYLNDYKCLVESELEAADKFGIDCLCVISDPYREAEGFGLEVAYPEDDLPTCHEPLIKELGDLKKIKVPDPYASKRMHDRILAVSEFKSQARSEYPIIGWVEGPIAEAADIRGLNNLIFDLMDEPGFVNELMDMCLDGAIRFSKEQVEAGADIIGVGDAAAAIIGPDLYKQYVFDREVKLIEAIHKMGAMVKLHICGNITALLPMIAKTGADIVDVDHMVDLAEAIGGLSEGQIVSGNYDPVGVLLQGSEADVDAAVRKCFAQMNGRRAIISAGCEVPRHTSHANMLRVTETLKELGV